MTQALTDYAVKLSFFDEGFLNFLRTSESIQENLRIREVRPAQAQMLETTGDLFRRFDVQFAPLTPPADLADFHQRMVETAGELQRSFNLFMTEPGPNWTVSFLYSRRSLSRALYSLYELQKHLPAVSGYFRVGGFEDVEAGDRSSSAVQRPVGFIHRERNDKRSDYSLYVPERYTPDRCWPLIICLHGGYGEGYEYIWTWLRAARARGHIVLSPKSFDVTWTMTPNSIDTRSILTMLDEVGAEYSIDRSRLFLTGLSDGGIMTYLLGIEHHEIFAGIAPVAGALHPMVDPMLRARRGHELPIFVIHGVHDFIFPVTFTRQTNDLLKSLGYNLKYEELPDWGHALTYSINERLVMPWFESLPVRDAGQSEAEPA
ncbi:MAG: phospholipase [Deltaproteobacteria bacterium]|nr:phospholipase [Deltaproteobacteria bacterium]